MIKKEEILKIVKDPKSHWSSFDDQQKRNFIGIWETRLRMAIEYHKSDELRILAEGVLAFVKNREPSRLRLYTQTNGNDNIGFMFDTGTEDHFQII